MSNASPPLNALRCFEAAARHLSVTRAAHELRVTPGALSHQIRGLEEETARGLIEAAQSMGINPFGIIFRVYLKEGIPGIVRGTAITMISLIGLTAMAGAVGGGGLGDFAIRYGHQRNQVDITYATVLILLLLVSVLQFIGTWIIKRTSH